MCYTLIIKQGAYFLADSLSLVEIFCELLYLKLTKFCGY